jgi:putative DNA primase/helicase
MSINSWEAVEATPEAKAAFAQIQGETGFTGSPTSDFRGGANGQVSLDPFAPLPIVRITCAADIQPEPIRWLWDGWLARGKLHIFAGQAGTGKTTIALALAATVTIGGRFPDGTRAPVGNVLIWSGEDNAKDTLIPRLLAAGADLSRVHFIGDVQHGDEIRSFDPATDISAMTLVAARIGDISLLIVDPIVNAVAGDSHKNGEVRRALQPLVDFGEKLGCAVLGISHFSKGTNGKEPLERVSGSLAFGALARIVLATAKINDGGSTRRIFCRAKSNIGLDHGGFEYDLNQKEIDGHKGVFGSYSVWGERVEGSARELLAENDAPGDEDEAARAERFLLEELEAGPRSQKEMDQECRAGGFSPITIKRAKKRLGIQSKKDGMKGGWYWSLPKQNYEGDHKPAEGYHSISMIPFGKNDPLRAESSNPAALNSDTLEI